MRLEQLGDCGLFVSQIGLGTRTWGADIDPLDAADMLRLFRDSGGTFIQLDGSGPAEPAPAVLGSALGQSDHDDVVISLRTVPTPQTPSLSRRHLLNSLDATLKHLGSDHIDLWFASGPRGAAPLEEIISAQEIALRSGRVRYTGLDNFSSWEGGRATALAENAGTPIAAWGATVSLLNPQILQADSAGLRQSGLGIVAGAPLAGGVLTGKYRHSTPPDSRAASPHLQAEISQYLNDGSSRIVEAVIRASEGLEMSPGQVSLLWVLGIRSVSTAVIGPRTTHQLKNLLAVSDRKLPKALIDVLTELAIQA